MCNWKEAASRTVAMFLMAALALAMIACGEYGKVEQGRVVSFNKRTGEVTLIADSTGGLTAKPAYDALPPLLVKAPANPEEMGPDPQAGKLMRVDLTKQELTIYDAKAGQ